MNEKIVEMLHLSLEPVGIFLGNASAICELEKGGALYSAECRRAGPSADVGRDRDPISRRQRAVPFCLYALCRRSMMQAVLYFEEMRLPDLYVILGNAIDNAIEYVEKQSDPDMRAISMRIERRGMFIGMQIMIPVK